jgi:hypothetical protein
MIAGCPALRIVNASHCELRQSLMEIAQALSQSTTLGKLYLSRNELFHAPRRAAQGVAAAWEPRLEMPDAHAGRAGTERGHD